MAHPAKNACPYNILSNSRTFFVTTKTTNALRLLQSERNAMLLIEVLRSSVAKGSFYVDDFVVMPDHLHLIVTLSSSMTIEKAMQLIKGGFSYRLKKEGGYPGDVWQRGYSEVRILDRESFVKYRTYIAQNPVKAGLVSHADEWPYCFNFLAKKKSQGLKPSSFGALGRPG
jgi:putative transposase